MAKIFNGIDVSEWQYTIDWKKVKESGQDFVFIRLGWCGYDGRIAGNNGIDKTFYTNIKGAIDAGLDVGVYVYSYARTADAAKVAAREAVELVKPYKLTYPIAFDIEDSMYYSASLKSSNTAICKAFLSEIENLGYYGILYTYTSFSITYLNLSELSQYDKWVADYRGSQSLMESQFLSSYGIWQYTGSGKVNGINVAVDRNYGYKDYSYIIQNAGLNGFTPIVTEPTEPDDGNDDENSGCLDECKEIIEHLQNLVSSYENDIDVFEQRLTEKDSEIEVLKIQLKDITNQRDSAYESMDTMEMHIAELQEKNNNFVSKTEGLLQGVIDELKR